MRNEGIVVSGGSFNAKAVAVGKGAKAKSVTNRVETTSLAELREQLAVLTAAVRASTELPDPAQSGALAELAEQELAKPEPNKKTFLTLLTSLKAAVGSAGSLATGVAEIIEAAHAVF